MRISDWSSDVCSSDLERPDFCLADFIAPEDSGRKHWIGGFAVTAGIGIEGHIERFRADHDDYNVILLNAIDDRPDEPLAEPLTRPGRTEFWVFGPDNSHIHYPIVHAHHHVIHQTHAT